MQAEPEDSAQAAAPTGAVGPKEQLIVLVRLQKLDLERDRQQHLIDVAEPAVAKRKASLEKATAALEDSRTRLMHARANAHDAEVDLKAKGEQVAKLELQLNTAKTNQEFHALQTHMAKIREEASSEEEKTLVLYDAIEAQETSVKAADAALKTAEAEFAEFQKECDADKEEALKELAGTDARRANLLDEIPEDLAQDYEKLRPARDGQAVCAVEDRSCLGCGVGLTPNDMSKIVACTRIIHCGSCQRILYSPEALKAQVGG